MRRIRSRPRSPTLRPSRSTAIVSESSHQLLQHVADEDEGDPLLAQAPDDGEQAGHLGRGEGGGGLVQDHQAGVARKHPHQQGQLLLGGAAVPDQPARVDLLAQQVAVQLDAAAVHGLPVRAKPRRGIAGPRNTLAAMDRFGQMGISWWKTLIPSRSRLRRVARPVGPALEQDPAGVRAVHAAQDLDQGGFARPVLPGQAEDLPLLHRQGHVLAGLWVGAEALGEVLDDQEGVAQAMDTPRVQVRVATMRNLLAVPGAARRPEPPAPVRDRGAARAA